MEPSTGTDITLGASGDTLTVPSGATLTVSGTMNASSITAGTVATARLGSGTASSSVFLRGDSSWATAGGDNTPAFFAYLSGDQSIADSTQTKITLDTEYYDTDSAFASNKFTVPADEGGKYLFVYGIGMDNMGDGLRGILKIAVNGATQEWGTMQQWHSAASQSTYVTASVIRTLVATDYVELYGYQTSGGSLGVQANKTFLSGLKLIGV